MEKESRESRNRFKRAIIVAYPTILIALLILVIVYSKFSFDAGVICPVKEIFGWECPGCGGTRMAVAMLNLDFYQAFRYNPFMFITLPAIGIIYVTQTIKFILHNEVSNWLDKFLIAYAIMIVIYGIIRNIGIFSWLAPTVV